jgi:hypothetical protein
MGVIAMRLVPEDNAGKISFFSAHIEAWLARASEIGVALEEVEALRDDLAAAKAADAKQQIAQQAAMSATQRRDNALRTMERRGASVIQKIRAHAAMEGNAVFVAAMIPAPANPSPIAAPGTPYRFEDELEVGRLRLRWRCRNPRGAAGTMYQLERSIDGGPMASLGITGDRSFIDATIPGGTRQVVYKVRAVRSTKVGGAALHTVALSSDGSRGLPLPQPANGKTMLVAA